MWQQQSTQKVSQAVVSGSDIQKTCFLVPGGNNFRTDILK